ncbi:MAG TPA: TRAP transporter fused permease subunit [Methylomirabilota bacterium]|nr:TRAP transporter fused permease subunit [Methylomirabilota bacterium]
MRRLTGYAALVVGVVGVVMSLYHLYARLTPAAPDTLVLRIIALAFCLVLSFLLFPCKATAPLDEDGTRLGEAAPSAPTDRIPWTDLGLAALSIAGLAYLFVYYDYITTRFPTAHPLTALDITVGTVVVLVVLEATRRTLGAALPVLALCFIVYGLVGPWLPGLLRHRGLTYEILIDQTFFTTEGLFGIPLGVAASYVILFIIFGAFLERSGAGQFFMNLANAVAGSQRGGPGKVSVISSSLFGTISGSAVANVMVDGWLTIPMMKRTGFKPEAAAAIEAVASTGGQIMPPVMGAASFVMAEFLGVPYSHIMIAAAIPALFYYGALFAAIHFNAGRMGLRGIPRAELPDLKMILWQQGQLLAPVLVIFWLLLEGFTATYAAIVSTVVVIYAWLLGPWVWVFVVLGAVLWVVTVPVWVWVALALAGLVAAVLRPGGLVRLGRLIVHDAPLALRDGAQQTVPVAMATAAAGIMIGIILQTGMAIKFTSFLVDFAGGNLMVALIITAIAAIILGTALPTTPAYIMLAALLIPALIKLGVPPLAAHMFAFYFGCLSSVTPPECLAVYAAASISRCSVWKAGLQAVKFAAAGFIVPFFFIYYPALLFQGSWGEIIQAAVTGSVGVVALAAGLEGYFIRTATWLERGLLIAAAFLLIDPRLVTDLIGLVLLGAALGMQKLRPAVVPANPRYL